jgi:PadR family transcriptional regulator AphA
MSRKNKTEWVVLGLLYNRSRTGYDLKKAIESQIDHFWRESFGQLYPLLNRLVEEDLAECQRIVAEGRPLRKLYKITESGKERFEEWLKTPVDESPPRIEILLKLFFAKRISKEQTIEHLIHFQKVTQDQVNIWERQKKEFASGLSENVEASYWEITLNYRIIEAKAKLRWVEDSLIRIKK